MINEHTSYPQDPNTEFEQLTPNQKEDYKRAFALAHRSNDARDFAIEHAQNMADALIEGGDTIAEQVQNGETEDDLFLESKNFEGLVDESEKYKKAAELLMPPRAAFDNQNAHQGNKH